MPDFSYSINRGDRRVPFEQMEGVERVLTMTEVASLLRWSYDSVRRYFKDQPGVLVKFQPKRYKRPYKQYMIPKSVFQREWDRMAAFNAAANTSRGVR